tara:strand:- start:149 stop:880 length:732 start_codon:yes stop_codon:yes gene_type:complete
MRFFYLILLIFFACDNSPEPFECPNDLIMDICGVCGGNNEDLDECGVCGGDGQTYECWNGQIVCGQSDCSNSFDNLPIDLKFLTEDFCQSSNPLTGEFCSLSNSEDECNLDSGYGCYWDATKVILTFTPIFWENSSNIPITIYTPVNYCVETSESTSDGIIDCDEQNNEEECINSSCNWLIPDNYNQAWVEYSITVPAQTQGYEFFFTECGSDNCGAFSYTTEEIFCAIIDGVEKCGKIRVVD